MYFYFYQMDVSVIILNFNTFDLTSACLRSVYKHTANVRFEVIVVDNGSTECYPCRFKEEFPEIILVESKTNLGFAKGNNLGLQFATGTSFLLLNSDTELLNNAIKLAFDRLKQAPEAACVAGKLFYQNGQVQHNIQRFPAISLLLIEILRLFHLLSPEKRGEILLGGYFSYQKEIYADWSWATFLMMRRELLTEFPGAKLHEDFFMYEEDKQWCYFL
ncbi:glycosyltransferase family 2 protein [Pontibacter qinzhouensis]|uniref:Glycosyltransferase family 2 protein n=1 Tax=Pontibacter qinzhouensis TaxID=2603253 RepID=A0A5C8J5W6_9BACT|nr:glycosyltransferase family 2 protein [Pontibacter qinzhouensis]TXK32791.1 glycosyltransferase family 2 protein [Pontibacter qinzhouensis]